MIRRTLVTIFVGLRRTISTSGPEGFKEKLGQKLGFVSKQVEGDLKRFRGSMGSCGVESGAWRGEV